MPIHLSTVVVRSTSTLQAYISRISQLYGNQNHKFLFALSANLPNHRGLANLVESLTKFNSIHGDTIGCLSSPILGVNSTDGLGSSNAISCSFAVFESSTAHSFVSAIPGKVAPQVGRWHAFRDKNVKSTEMEDSHYQPDVPWADVWDRSAHHEPLPEGLRTLDPEEVETVIHFSDLAPEGLSNSLRAFRKATKPKAFLHPIPFENFLPQLGLIASSTPFITGRPVTLFHNHTILDSGAVGIALKKRNNNDPQLSSQVQFLEAKSLSEPLTITRCEGNMINTLNDSNPTQLLLSAIKDSGLQVELSGSFKEDEQFSLGVIAPNGNISRIYRITAGDPSRGSISLDSERAPAAGTVVQFLHHPKSSHITIPARYFDPSPSLSSRSAMGFLTVQDTLPQAAQLCTPIEDEIVLQNTFWAASENGFVLSRAPASIPGQESITECEDMWRCSIPGGLGLLEWR